MIPAGFLPGVKAGSGVWLKDGLTGVSPDRDPGAFPFLLSPVINVERII
jgi:hypothetical protein